MKRLFALGVSTPNYVLALETGMHSIYHYTVKLHCGYIKKVMNMSPSRLPYIVAREIINKKLSWFSDWSRWDELYDCGMRAAVIENKGENKIKKLLTKIDTVERNKNLEALACTQYHTLYAKLDFNLKERHYLKDSNNLNFMRIILKTKAELHKLNYRQGKSPNETLNNCNLCNLHAIEDHYHGLFIRLRYFGKRILNEEELILILNGRDWDNLYGYVSTACRYRALIESEFS